MTDCMVNRHWNISKVFAQNLKLFTGMYSGMVHWVVQTTQGNGSGQESVIGKKCSPQAGAEVSKSARIAGLTAQQTAQQLNRLAELPSTCCFGVRLCYVSTIARKCRAGSRREEEGEAGISGFIHFCSIWNLGRLREGTSIL